ncbi:MAG: radical SAM family heme chaperone HemW [Synergistaceae bacterium]|nr:radical SAM family heme chaperone HemW [Synergistaceae bacterium]MBQ3448872.1 radical SAM family heme chaperone HemW [Synergistaceae bacterium]MBQ3693332.1 radical SAM family heme chaperone HemW [Synergistaceae bacterium]MBQ9628464.1 radical SAM family heme chaperone HemW [Synergistaceae bacterium]MBR0251609.1 radical SAM family heme chaperone HemW [Synergistaceae bacterium]
MQAKTKTYGLYVHVPFCERKCRYCSFYSVADHESVIDSYLDALEIQSRRLESKLPLKTLYIGGGTPSVLNLSQWHKLISIINKYFDTSCLTEATTEANPNSITHEHISFLKDNNISRVSLGIQSINDYELTVLGRVHDKTQALKAMELVNDSGLNLSCDLIFAIPGQTLRTWDKSLRTVMDYASHISTYQLTLEPDTPLAREFTNEELNSQGYALYRYSQYILPRHNFIQYEISSFAKENHECVHNLSYWNHDNIIALGPSAVGYIDGIRYSNPRTLNEYFSAAMNNFQDESFTHEELSPHERAIELAILSLRTRYGINRKDLLPEIERVLDSMPDDLFIKTPERISLSKRGMRLGNAIWSELIDL